MAKATRPKKKSPPRPSPKRTPPPKPDPRKKGPKKAGERRRNRGRASRVPSAPQPAPGGATPSARSGPRPPQPPGLSRNYHQRTLVVAAKTPQALQKAIDAAEELTRHGVKVECVNQPKTGAPWFTLTFMETKR